MENKMLLTQEEILREKFNSQDFKTDLQQKEDIKNLSDGSELTNRFLFYFMHILQFAFELEIISANVRNMIANILGKAIEKKANGDILKLSNYCYILTVWFQSMSNWEAWKELSKITNVGDASTLINSSVIWFLKELEKMDSELEVSKSMVYALRDENIFSTFKFLKQEIQNCKEMTVNFFGMHKSMLPIPYILLNSPDSDNYFSRIRENIKYFSIEISILFKIDAKTIFNRKRLEISRGEQKNIDFTIKLQNEFDEKRDELNREYKSRKAAALEAEKAYEKALNDLESEFNKRHPELKGECLENAFSEYLDTLPESFFNNSYEDVIEIDKWYSEQRSNLISKYENAQKKLENDIAQKETVVISDDCSLYTLIKEFAIFSLAKRELIHYPATFEESNSALLNMPIEEAIPIFFEEVNVSFSKEELSYLKKAIDMQH